MTVPDGSTIRVAAHFTSLAASDVVNIYHFFTDSVGDVSVANLLTDLQDLLDDLMTNVEGSYPTSTTLDEIEAWIWNDTLDRWDFLGSTTSTWAGTVSTTEVLPAANAPMVMADTVDAHSRGRKYLPPILEIKLSSGLIQSGVITELLNFLGDYTATYVGTYLELNPGVWQVANQAFKLFTGTGVVENVMAYQRRRKSGVGS